jgi:hypothetical protein
MRYSDAHTSPFSRSRFSGTHRVSLGCDETCARLVGVEDVFGRRPLHSSGWIRSSMPLALCAGIWLCLCDRPTGRYPRAGSRFVVSGLPVTRPLGRVCTIDLPADLVGLCQSLAMHRSRFGDRLLRLLRSFTLQLVTKPNYSHWPSRHARTRGSRVEDSQTKAMWPQSPSSTRVLAPIMRANSSAGCGFTM